MKFVFLLFCPLLALASNLSAPFSLTSAKLLPKGVRNLRYMGVMAQGTEKYGSQGNIIPIGDALNTDITVRKLIEGKKEDEGAAQAAVLEGYLANKGFQNLDEVVAQTTGEVNVAIDVHVPVFAYGLFDKLTLALALPIIQSKVEVSTGMIAGNGLLKIQNALIADNNILGSESLEKNTANATSIKLERYGYEPLKNEQKTEIGDVKLIAKYELLKKRDWLVSLQPELTLPTGRPRNIDKALDIPAGDGQWDVGLGLIHDYQLHPAWLASHGFGVVFQLPDTTERRIPQDSDSALSPDKDNQVKRDLGDRYYNQLTLTYFPWEPLGLSVSHTLQYKTADSYRGNKYEANRYEYLAANSIQNMQSLTAGVKYSTLPAFRQKNFPLPLMAGLNHTKVVSGKNVTKDSITALELSIFF